MEFNGFMCLTDILLVFQAKSIDSVLRCVVFNDGSCVNFDKLLIATGAR